MRIKAFLLTSFVLPAITASVTTAAAYKIQNIDLVKIDNMTVATIYASGQIEYTHRILNEGQIKVIVDFKNAEHALPQKDYFNLPSETIKSIRTSQFSLDPMIARIVFDTDKPITYTVRDAGDKLIINFPTPDDRDFPSWAAVKPAIDAQEKPEPAGNPQEDSIKKVIRKSGRPADNNNKTTRKAVRKVPSRKEKGTVIELKHSRPKVIYNSRGTRDPFAPLLETGKGERAFGEIPVPSLEDLKLVGILQDEGGGRVALLEDSEGNGFMLRTGDKIKNGWVSMITEDKVFFQVTEFGWSRTVSMKLQPPTSE